MSGAYEMSGETTRLLIELDQAERDARAASQRIGAQMNAILDCEQVAARGRKKAASHTRSGRQGSLTEAPSPQPEPGRTQAPVVTFWELAGVRPGQYYYVYLDGKCETLLLPSSYSTEFDLRRGKRAFA